MHLHQKKVVMGKKIILDKYEQEIEDNFEKSSDIENLSEVIATFEKAAKLHIKYRKSTTLQT